MKSPADVLELTLKLLSNELPPVTVDAWFDDMTVVDFNGSSIILHTPIDFKKKVIEEKFLGYLKRILKDIFFDDIEVIITTGQKDDGLFSADVKKDEYTFEQFIVGSSNKFAHAAAIAVSKNPAEKFNPLFIYGQSGLGKTHLLHSISTVIRNNNPSSKIIYIKGEDFTNELVSSIQEGSVQNFRNKFRMADLLLVDDIQFVAGKERTQEEFFHTFNALHEAKKQIVLTSDRPPKEINTLEDRLKTRFEWGLLADIQPPDYETRLAIIRAKSDILEIDIPPEIVDYIAETITSNVRQLEGTVKKMVALNELMGREIDMSLAHDAIQDIFKENPGLNPTPELIIREVAKYYCIPADKLSSNNRSKEMVLPRQIAIYLVRKLTEYSSPEIGKVFSRDHTTVLHSINKIEEYLKSTSEMDNIIKTLISNIRGQ